MLFDLTIPCNLKTFSGKKCLSGKVICAFFCPAYRTSPVSGGCGDTQSPFNPDLAALKSNTAKWNELSK
jgi:hypothetical protein